MMVKLKILGMGPFMLMLSFRGATAFGKDTQPKTRVVDLNQIDLEQVEDNWENTPANAPVNLNGGLKIKDIVEPSNEYTYASFGKPDPFAYPQYRSKLAAGNGQETEAGAGATIGIISSNEIAIRSPLQAYPIDVLKVKGVWQLADGDMRAVVMTPKNEGVVVKNGDPMSSGKVLKIDKDALVVRLYRLRKDGVREFDDKLIPFGVQTHQERGIIKLAPGKVAQFPGMDSPADSVVPEGAAFPPVPAGRGGAPGTAGAPGTLGAPGDAQRPPAAPQLPGGAIPAAAPPALGKAPDPYIPPVLTPKKPSSGRPGATN